MEIPAFDNNETLLMLYRGEEKQESCPEACSAIRNGEHAFFRNPIKIHHFGCFTSENRNNEDLRNKTFTGEDIICPVPNKPGGLIVFITCKLYMQYK